MKGFVISVDAVISLIITFSLLVAINGFFAEARPNSLNDIKLSAVSEDVLAVLEKTGKLENSVKENSNNEIAKYLNKTSLSLCFEINIYDYDHNSSALSSAAKKDCRKTDKMLVISTKRSFFSEEKFYWAEMKSWHKVNQ